MTTINDKIISGTFSAALSAPIGLIGGYLFGFVYAKLADLPADRAGKAYAVFGLALATISAFVTVLTSEMPNGKFFRSATVIIVGLVGIGELRRRGLMGDNLTIAGVILLACAALGALHFPRYIVIT